jgi:hypothetical protein
MSAISDMNVQKDKAIEVLEKMLEKVRSGDYDDTKLKDIIDMSEKIESREVEEYPLEILRYLFRGWFLTTLNEERVNGDHVEVE